MAKIVIIAPADADVEDAVKLLKGAGNEVEVEQPTPKSLLHIVLGLLGPNAYGFGAGYAYSPGDAAADAPPPPDEEEDDLDVDPSADPTDTDAAVADDSLDMDFDNDGADDFQFESLGKVVVDGEEIDAVSLNSADSILCVEKLAEGPKTSYVLNESTFSFWPANIGKPMQRIEVITEEHDTSIEVLVVKGEKTQLQVGRDMIKMFECACDGKKYSAHEDHNKKDGTWYVDDPKGDLHQKGMTKHEAQEMAKKMNGT